MQFSAKRRIARVRRSGFSFFNLITLSEERTLMMLAVIVGLSSGLSAFVFKRMLDGVQHLFRDPNMPGHLASAHWLRMFFPAIGGLLVGLLFYYFDRDAKGHGTPEIIYAIRRMGGRIRSRVAFLTSVTSALTIGTGGSAGPEGPIIQIGASVGSSIGQLFHVSPSYLKTLAAAGAAGGLAAVFNAPIAAVIFALEVLLREFKVQVFSMVVFSSVIASITSHVLLGNNTFLPTPPFGIQHPAELGLYFLLGLIAAPVAKAYAVTMLWMAHQFSAWKTIPRPLKPMIGGLLVGIIGLIFPMILGSGHLEVTAALSTDTDLFQSGFSFLLFLIFGKIIATSLTIGSGGSGGDLMPSLFIGAMMGTVFGKGAHLFFTNIAPTGAYAVVGMALVFSVVTNAPVTAIMMMFEITQDYRIILPLMFSVTIAMLMAKQMNEIGIYGRVLLQRGLRIDGGDVHDPVMRVTAAEVMVKNIELVWQNMTVEKLTQVIEEGHHTGFPVVNAQGELLGMITYMEVHKAVQDQLDMKKVLIDQIMRKDISTVFPDDVLVDVVRKMQESHTDRIAVVEPDNPKRLLGLITRSNILSIYETAADPHE